MRAIGVVGAALFSLACSPASGSERSQVPPPAPTHPPPAISAQAPPAIAEPEPFDPATTIPPPRSRSRDPWRANDDPSDNDQIGPPAEFADCHERLDRAGVKHRPGSLPIRKMKGRAGDFVCGAPQVVIYELGPTATPWGPAFAATCGLAIALSHLEEIAQEEAARHLGRKITRFKHGGTYSCRTMSRFKMVSEHSYGNALDLYGFDLDNGTTISVMHHFGPADQPHDSPEARFLRTLAHRLYDEGIFSVVLTPHFDSLHRDHFHVDMARYRMDGTRAR